MMAVREYDVQYTLGVTVRSSRINACPTSDHSRWAPWSHCARPSRLGPRGGHHHTAAHDCTTERAIAPMANTLAPSHA